MVLRTEQIGSFHIEIRVWTRPTRTSRRPPLCISRRSQSKARVKAALHLSDAWWMLPCKEFAWFLPVLPSLINIGKRPAKKRSWASSGRTNHLWQTKVNTDFLSMNRIADVVLISTMVNALFQMPFSHCLMLFSFYLIVENVDKKPSLP